MVFSAEVAAHDAGVQGVGGDAGAIEAAGQLVAEHDVGELGLVIGALPRVTASALQVVKVDSTHRLCTGGHGDDPRWCAGFEPVQKQVGEQERGEVVEGEGTLQAVGGRVSVCPEPADVVDQHVESWVSIQDADGEPTDLGLRGHVGGEGVDGRVR